MVTGELALDALVKAVIREHLTYRFLEVADGGVARAIELQIRRGCLPAGPPLLNPVWVFSTGETLPNRSEGALTVALHGWQPRVIIAIKPNHRGRSELV